MSDDCTFDCHSDSTHDDDGIETHTIWNQPITNNQQLQDVCHYSDAVLYLYIDGVIEIVPNDGKIRKITNNRQLRCLFSFCGYLYAIDKYGCICTLSHHWEDSTWWLWKPTTWSPKNVVRVSVTLDDVYLWIETTHQCLLVNKKMKRKKYPVQHRVYGKNKDCYLKFHENECKVMVNKRVIESINDVVTGVMDVHMNVTLISNAEYLIYKDIKMVNNCPYYIKRN